ncbi:hypothetical protein [Lactobacillus acidophilus]|uniref:hypothetical protein n=1 Tax=Lactobacillus acidophilus TaxID=1579 RepID=UPI0021A4A910|nr:hypothetical protein [Lactobacillus acidophilus]
MNKARNLPNLAKKIKRIIGKMVRENNELLEKSMTEDYDMKRDPNLHAVKFGNKLLFITKSAHEDFVNLLENVEIVFNAENIEYDIDQVSSKLEKFIDNIVSNNESYNLDMINSFIDDIKEPDHKIYFFRLFNFVYKEKINLGQNIIIISGQELLKEIPEAEELNRKAEENPKYEKLIQPEDILLGVSVIDSGKSDKSYYHALDSANYINNIINFLNGFNHKPSQVLELS